MASLKALFWDVDGTLADTEMDGHRPAFNAAFHDLELPFIWDEELYAALLVIPGGQRRVLHYARSKVGSSRLDNSTRFVIGGCITDGGLSTGRYGSGQVSSLLVELGQQGIDQWSSRPVAAPLWRRCSMTT